MDTFVLQVSIIRINVLLKVTKLVEDGNVSNTTPDFCITLSLYFVQKNS